MCGGEYYGDSFLGDFLYVGSVVDAKFCFFGLGCCDGREEHKHNECIVDSLCCILHNHGCLFCWF